MAAGNTWVVSGNMAGDPEVREVGQNGATKARFQVCWNRNFRANDQADWEKEPHFIPCEAWNGLARTIAKFKSGDLITVYGRADWHRWDTDAGPREAIILLVDHISGEKMFEKTDGSQSKGRQTASAGARSSGGGQKPSGSGGRQGASQRGSGSRGGPDADVPFGDENQGEGESGIPW